MTPPIKHGMCRSKVYGVWAGMRSRCQNPTNKAFPSYGGRGILVCEQWNVFANFLRDMGEPGPGQSLERINNNLGYEPGNCQWASRATQNRNKRSNRPITVNGVTKLLCEWAEETGLTHCTILNRIRLGWTVEEAITLPLVTKRKGIKRGLKIKDHQYGDEHAVEWRETNAGGFMDLQERAA